jgi:NAD(P)-dependent dehydrogenase (short-subunit alcohol dehydrogenase family)
MHADCGRVCGFARGLSVRTVLVAGAAGGIGEGVVRALLAGGEAKVYATSRSAERLEALRGRLEPEALGRFTPIAGAAGDFAGAALIAERVEALGGVDAVVAILGRGWWSSGPLLDIAPEEWRSVLDEMLTGHFALARALIPQLSRRAGSLYLALGGGAAFEPLRDAGVMSVAAAGQVMLTRTLDREVGASPPRIRELIIDGPVSTRESRHFADPRWITADDVGRVVADLVLRGTTSWQPAREEGPLLVIGQRR